MNYDRVYCWTCFVYPFSSKNEFSSVKDLEFSEIVVLKSDFEFKDALSFNYHDH